MYVFMYCCPMASAPEICEMTALALQLRRKKITQSEIASALCVSQSQVSRALSGKSGKRSGLMERICKYVYDARAQVTAELVRSNDELIGALTQTWDGSSEHAHALATVIRSLVVMSHYPPRTRRTDRDRRSVHAG